MSPWKKLLPIGLILLPICVWLAGFGCGDGVTPQGEDGGSDISFDSGLDSGRDGSIKDGGVTDSGDDAGRRDGGFDSGDDAGMDSGTDGGVDSGTDAGSIFTDSGPDAGPDAEVDSGTDSGLDGGFDAGFDCGWDAGEDIGPTVTDGGMDAEIDSGNDSGEADGSPDDGGVSDSGTEDSGAGDDSGIADGAVEDAGTDDSGSGDAGITDSGRLAIHFINVGQGDGIVIISPGGQAVLVDSGVLNKCTHPVAYVQTLGLTEFQYVISSHYHADHIGCTPAILQKIPIADGGIAYDHGDYDGGATYKNYVAAVGSHRKTAVQGDEILLDDGAVRIIIVALNGNGVKTTNENDLSVVAVLRFGQFDLSLAGDLSGYKVNDYEDIETSVAPMVGQVELYKVNHHCSPYSSNDTWLDTLKPKAAIVTVGDGNVYNHPDAQCLARLHARGVETYWSQTGNGATPDPVYDVVGGDIVVNAGISGSFDITWDGGTKGYPGW